MPDSLVSAGPADYEDPLGLGGGKALPFGGPQSGTLELAMPLQPQGSGASEPLTRPLPRLSAGKGFFFGGGCLLISFGRSDVPPG